jgi:hypothetical protein
MGILVTPDMKCPLCGEPFADRPVFSFTFVVIEDPRFKCFDDYAVHQTCLNEWELRDEFVAVWNERVDNTLLTQKWRLVIQKDGTLKFEKDPLWEHVLNSALLPLIYYPIYLPVHAIVRACCYIATRPPKCQYCKKRLKTRFANQCFNCGMDWHNPEGKRG